MTTTNSIQIPTTNKSISRATKTPLRHEAEIQDLLRSMMLVITTMPLKEGDYTTGFEDGYAAAVSAIGVALGVRNG